MNESCITIELVIDGVLYSAQAPVPEILHVSHARWEIELLVREF